MRTDDLDTAFLAWSMHKRPNIDAMPLNQTVLEFEFSAKPESIKNSGWWSMKGA